MSPLAPLIDELDRTDPLAAFRAEFFLPPGQIYLDGNSLGALSRRAESSLQRAIEQWRTLGINGWTAGDSPWLTLAESAARHLAPLVGAAPEEICVTAQTTVNLHQLLATLFDARHPSRRVIVGDTLNFASDSYALQSHLRLRGLDPATHLRLVGSRDGRVLQPRDILAAFTSDVQLAVLPAVLFTSGQLLDVAALTRAAHARGILVGFDCSHSIGAVPHAFDRDGVDFAFWSSYKYLNAGLVRSGAFTFIAATSIPRPVSPAGGGATRAPIPDVPRHEPADGAAALHIGTPPILSLAPLLASLELIAEAGGISALRAKSLRQTQLLMDLADRHLAAHGFTLANPRMADARGGHVALAHPDAWRICQALKAAGVMPDFRAPDLIRLAPAPLYNRYAECAEAILLLERVMLEQAYIRFPAAPALVP